MAPTRRFKSAPGQAIYENTVVIEAVLETAPQEALQDTSHPLAGSSKPITQNDFGRLFTFFEAHLRQERESFARTIGELTRQTPLANPNPHTPSSSTGKVNFTNFEKLQANSSLRVFISWRSKWEDLSRLERIPSMSLSEQVSAFRLTLSHEMMQVVEVVLGFKPDTKATVNEILDSIFKHLRSQRNVALDRLDFEKCQQEINENFDSFYVRLRRTAECAELCRQCYDTRIITRLC